MYVKYRDAALPDHYDAPSRLPEEGCVLTKKSFSSANCPILALCSFKSTGGVSRALLVPPKPSSTRSTSCLRHSVI